MLSSAAHAIHGPRFESDKSFVNRMFRLYSTAPRIKMSRVYGGIVTHHIPDGIPLMAQFYSKVKKNLNPRTIIILAPDHVDAGKYGISISEEDFVTPFGKLSSSGDMVKKILRTGLAGVSEKPFELDHSIHSQMLLISKYFPKAKVVPIVFRSSISVEDGRTFGSMLSGLVDSSTFIVASIDFAHYLEKNKSRAIDNQSAALLQTINPRLAGLVEADSPQALSAFMAAMSTLGANKSEAMGVFNSGDFGNNQTSTTGYVVKFFGR
ncbi:MAG: hypothetical protein UW46_C0004G0084 [Candidatus Yanofskybacteria bacterium GW2011_GWF1_44_227]|uniref:AmmeMemoRadiSam system protein B n=1 Tax=Candidatus Yanofskybacteria bacterium GW2011_GWE2_40_11 TaxID=1619033 RepID=A0A0G0TS69_9BACT|nr:MAG: hypothetical protein UT69_C0009G0016 [Candidatus Yanofskybacteria bacterium GW2011_GWE1_40_10]KKR40697.1 MAG: hypothetical protein UT75_C0005G0005 [Candidatus Yanofskybacteria bacterium GW2011_GWE2_40_11]KKT15593.1 MAG: hypothetical protein UV97_C0004G0009 [Candidatus Yanofskybacteria bacterium GW2011_GWF2_43_596]KKT53357.1 MAG: hypothetical protein UW46_C0004G0084 [Candidatus Yanofskybacteria bacterium GW2011_GWF1_44_227]